MVARDRRRRGDSTYSSDRGCFCGPPEHKRSDGGSYAKCAALDKANAGDSELSAIARRIFDTRPITLPNLKQRAVLARYWHQYAYDVEAWTKPEDCDSWEDEVIAQLIRGVLQIDAPPSIHSKVGE
jgi:hypothetical protein